MMARYSSDVPIRWDLRLNAGNAGRLRDRRHGVAAYGACRSGKGSQALDERGRETDRLFCFGFVTGDIGRIRVFRLSGFRHVLWAHKAALDLRLALMVDMQTLSWEK